MSDDDDDFLKTMEEMEEICAERREESEVEKSTSETISTAGDETIICARSYDNKTGKKQWIHEKYLTKLHKIIRFKRSS